MLSKLKDPISALTHFAGALLSVIGFILLIYQASSHATIWHTVSFSIFGISLILLYSASSLYHSIPASERTTALLRKIDHMMIFILIAGTYTPICLVPLRGPWGWSLFSVIWIIAAAGILIKAFLFHIPRWLSTLIYIAMGWLVVVALFPLIHRVSLAGAAWMIAGGLFYSIGALIYAVQRPRISRLSFHDIFHIFVLAGSFCHYWLMYQFILKI